MQVKTALVIDAENVSNTWGDSDVTESMATMRFPFCRIMWHNVRS